MGCRARSLSILRRPWLPVAPVGWSGQPPLQHAGTSRRAALSSLAGWMTGQLPRLPSRDATDDDLIHSMLNYTRAEDGLMSRNGLQKAQLRSD